MTYERKISYNPAYKLCFVAHLKLFFQFDTRGLGKKAYLCALALTYSASELCAHPRWAVCLRIKRKAMQKKSILRWLISLFAVNCIAMEANDSESSSEDLQQKELSREEREEFRKYFESSEHRRFTILKDLEFRETVRAAREGEEKRNREKKELTEKTNALKD